MGDLTPAELQEPVHRSRRFRWSAGLLVVLLVASAAGIFLWQSVRLSCEEQAVRQASALLVGQLDRFDHSYQFATSAFQSALDRPLYTLQLIHTYTGEIPVPACMQTAKGELIQYMGTVIRAFQAYRAHEADATFRELLEEADAHYDQFSAELEAVGKCAPFCFP